MPSSSLAEQLTLRDSLVIAAEKAEIESPKAKRTLTLRTIVCALRDRDVTARSRGECDGCPDAEATAFLQSMLEHREEELASFEEASDLVRAEQAREDIAVIREFLPAPLDGEDLKAAVRDVVTDLDAHKLRDIGRCMEELKGRYGSRIEKTTAYKVVREALR